jgi:O-antigen/teichoic acid export membrane protein
MTKFTTVAVVDQAVSSSTSLITGVIIGRTCSAEEFGYYMLALSLVLIAGNLQNTLILTPYMIYGPRLKTEELREYNGSTMVHLWFLSAFSILVLCGACLFVFLGLGPRELSRVFWALTPVIAFILFKEYVRRICHANFRFRAALILDSILLVIQTAGLLLLVHFNLLDAIHAFWMIGLACLLASAGWFIGNRTEFHIRSEKILPDLKVNWSLGRWVFASGLLYALSVNFYPWILTVFHGPAATGIWAACIGLVGLSNPLLVGFQNIIGPSISRSFAEYGETSLQLRSQKITFVIAGILVFLCLFILVYGGFFLGFLYGHQYGGYGLVAFVLSFNLVVEVFSFYISRVLFVIGRGDLDFFINFAALIVLLSAGIWLTRALGPLGAALSIVLATVVTAALKFAIFSRRCSAKAAAPYE